MKTLNIHFTEGEYSKLVKAKALAGVQNWHNFILQRCSKGVSVRRHGNKDDTK